MRGILRLIDGLLGGDPFATYVLIFAVVTTLIIFVIAEIVQRRRKAKRLLEATRSGPAKPGGR